MVGLGAGIQLWLTFTFVWGSEGMGCFELGCVDWVWLNRVDVILGFIKFA